MVEKSGYDQYAIIETGGKQYQAIAGKTLGIERLEGEPGDKVSFDKVLFRKKAAGSYEVGRPHLDGDVKASIIKHLRGPKLVIFKFKRRKKVRVKKGHRQEITVVRIETI